MPSDPTPAPHDVSRWGQLHRRLHRHPVLSLTTRIVVTLVGAVVLAGGLVMVVTPGPGLLGIVAGLAILATEWEWADRWLARARRALRRARPAAAATDPRVRRRRIAVVGALGAGTTAAAGAYVAVRDWPGWTVSAWDRAQALAGFLPELPGM